MREEMLTFDKLFVGRTLKPFTYRVTWEDVRAYAEAIGEDVAFYQQRQIAPPTMAAVYTLEANRTEGRVPPASIQTGQEFYFLAPVRIGDTLTTVAKVVEKYEHKGRKYVSLEAETVNQDGVCVVRAKTSGIWSQ